MTVTATKCFRRKWEKKEREEVHAARLRDWTLGKQRKWLICLAKPVHPLICHPTLEFSGQGCHPDSIWSVKEGDLGRLEAPSVCTLCIAREVMILFYAFASVISVWPLREDEKKEETLWKWIDIRASFSFPRKNEANPSYHAVEKLYANFSKAWIPHMQSHVESKSKTKLNSWQTNLFLPNQWHIVEKMMNADPKYAWHQPPPEASKTCWAFRVHLGWHWEKKWTCCVLQSSPIFLSQSLGSKPSSKMEVRNSVDMLKTLERAKKTESCRHSRPPLKKERLFPSGICNTPLRMFQLSFRVGFRWGGVKVVASWRAHVVQVAQGEKLDGCCIHAQMELTHWHWAWRFYDLYSRSPYPHDSSNWGDGSELIKWMILSTWSVVPGG